MLITAKASHLPHTPRKLKLVVDSVRGKDAKQTIEILKLTPKRAAGSLVKVISQALGNAKNNFGLTGKDFTIKDIFVTQGRKLKRHRIAARGRYKPYAIKTSHLTIKLEAKKDKNNKLINKKQNGTKS